MNSFSPRPEEQHRRSARAGFGFGLLAYSLWGFFPLYFKAVASVPPLEVVSHRIAWSLALLLAVVILRGRFAELRHAFRTPRTLGTLVATALLISTNWLVFIIAVEHGQVLQSSLGYFITPLVNVLLGFLFLKERLRGWQRASLLLAMAGVLILTVAGGSVPWAALILAFTFGSYGLLRKVVAVDSLLGLTVETLVLGPVAVGYLLFLAGAGRSAFLAGPPSLTVLLASAVVVTSVPLLLFAAAARRLRLATIGFLQYLTPSLHFLLAVALYGEPFTPVHLASFACIWAGLLLYSWDALRGVRTR